MEAVERRKSQRRPLARAEKVAQMKKPTMILAMITLKRRGVQERVKEAREVALKRRKRRRKRRKRRRNQEREALGKEARVMVMKRVMVMVMVMATRMKTT